MIKNILLTIGGLLVAIAVTLIIVFITEILFNGVSEQGWHGTEPVLGYIVIGLVLSIFGIFSYYTWESYWKAVFISFSLLIILALVIEFSHITSFKVWDYISDTGIIIGMLGLFLYSFNLSFLSKEFWKLFFWLYLIINIYDLILLITPQSIANFPSFLVGYNTKLNITQPDYGTIILLLFIETPILYAIYQLSNRKN